MEAMKEEIQSHLVNGTWKLTDLFEERKTIKYYWVFLTKWNINKNPIRYKACLITKGYIQQASIDYKKTFTSVACLDFLHFLLTLAITLNWEIHQIDIKTAFLNSNLKEEQDPKLHIQYQSFVGLLMYAMLGICLDIYFTITKLAQFSSNPIEEYFQAVQHAIHYFNTTIDFKLI
jgi:hypothetical protein